MDIRKLNQVIEGMKEDLGGGLVSSDFYSSNDGTTLVGFNSQPKAAALFNQISRYLTRTLKESGFPGIGKYYLVNLENNHVVVVLPAGEFQWGLLVDLSKTSLGVLLNVVVPKVLDDNAR